jgi:hypothetical protein
MSTAGDGVSTVGDGTGGAGTGGVWARAAPLMTTSAATITGPRQ